MRRKRRARFEPSYSIAASPFRKLPNELQLRIFRKIADPIKISRVCPAWKTLAFSDSLLWTTIKIDDRKNNYCCNDPTVLKVFLERSRSATLTVQIRTCSVRKNDKEGYYFKDGNPDGYEGDHEEKPTKCICLSSLTSIMSNLPRIKVLKIFCQPRAESRGVTKVLRKAFSSHEAPVLERLELSTYETTWWSPGTIFYPMEAPALRKLLLNDVVVDWNATMFQNLTELYLAIFDTPDQSMSTTQLFNILLACPSLTTLLLHLRIVMDTASNSQMNYPYPINLQSLTEVNLWDLPIDIYTCILQNVKVPRCANWYIQDKYPSEDRLSQFCGFLGSLAATIDQFQSRDLLLVLENETISFFCSRLTESCASSDQLRDCLISVSFRLDDYEDLSTDQSQVSQNIFFNKAAQIISALNTNGRIIRLCVRFRDLENYTGSGQKSVVDRSKDWTELILRALPRLEHLQCMLFFSINEIVEEEEEEEEFVDGTVDGDGDDDSEPFIFEDEDGNILGDEKVEEKRVLKNKHNQGSEDEDEIAHEYGHRILTEARAEEGSCSYYYKMGLLEGTIGSLTPPAIALPQISIPSSNLLCPNLKCVEIAHGYGLLSRSLLQCLKLRSTCGVPIRTLRLTWSCPDKARKQISDDWLAEAKQYVECVHIQNEDDAKNWNRVFRPKYERTGDNSYGYLSGYYQYGT